MTLTGDNRRIGIETCPIATLSITDPTRTDLRTNSGVRGEKPANDRLSHDTAFML
jgi:hypothetical protein